MSDNRFEDKLKGYLGGYALGSVVGRVLRQAQAPAPAPELDEESPLVEHYKLMARNGREISAHCGGCGKSVRFPPEQADEDTQCPFCSAEIRLRLPTDYRTAPCQSCGRAFTFLPQILVDYHIHEPLVPSRCDDCAAKTVTGKCPYCSKALVLDVADLERESRPCPACHRTMVAEGSGFLEHEGHHIGYAKKPVKLGRVWAVLGCLLVALLLVRDGCQSRRREREAQEEKALQAAQKLRDDLAYNNIATTMCLKELGEALKLLDYADSHLAEESARMAAGEAGVREASEQARVLRAEAASLRTRLEAGGNPSGAPADYDYPGAKGYEAKVREFIKANLARAEAELARWSELQRTGESQVGRARAEAVSYQEIQARALKKKSEVEAKLAKLRADKPRLENLLREAETRNAKRAR